MDKKIIGIPTVQPHWLHFARAITRPWVGLLGWLWYILVEEGLQFFLRYSGPISVNGKDFKNQVENWKIAFSTFFVPVLKTKTSIMKCPFLLFFSHHGVKRDWYRHNWAQWFGYLGHTPNIWRQKSVTLWQLSQCPIITFSSFSDVTKHLLLWQVSHSDPFTLVKRL